MVDSFVSLPRTTINLVTRDQDLGLQKQRALAIGQLAPAAKAFGLIKFSANPSADDTITLNGTAWTFKASGATGAQTNIGVSLAATLATLVTNLNASADAEVTKCTYSVLGTALFVLMDTGGTAGNSYTLAASVATVSAATLLGGTAAPGSATAGTLVEELPRTAAEINTLFGEGSHLALIANGFRSVNAITVMDALPLADGSGAIHATAQIAFSGTVTQAGSIFISVCDEVDHTYQIDLNSGDTPDDLLTLLAAAIDADRYMPFRYAHDGVGAIQFMAKNAGLHANTWLLKVKGAIPGLSVTLTGWAGGATNPSLSTVFDLVENVRYQTVLWSETYTLSTIANFLDPRMNVDNDVMEGRAFCYRSAAFSTVKSDAAGINSSEVVLLTNKPVNTAAWIGPHIPACPDVIMAKFAGARARRFEQDVSISDIVSNNEPRDQFGGDDKASLPYFNTPILGVGRPLLGSGYSGPDQIELRDNGVSVIGLNREATAVVTGEIVTTWLTDTAGNPDDTWKYLEWRDSHGVIREYQVLNLRKRFAQYRLTSGNTIPNYAMANELMIRGYILGLVDDLMQMTVIQKGQPSRQYTEDNLTVELDLANRKVFIAEKVLLVGQLAEMAGTVKFAFTTN